MRDVIVTFNLSRVVMSPYSRYVMTGKWSAPTREEWRSVPADLNDQDVPFTGVNMDNRNLPKWPAFKTYTLEEDLRTGSPLTPPRIRGLIYAHLRRVGCHQFVRVALDGSGQAWNEWPSTVQDEYPVGHFPVELRPRSPRAPETDMD